MRFFILRLLIPSVQEVGTHFIGKLVYKMGQYFLDIQYLSQIDIFWFMFDHIYVVRKNIGVFWIGLNNVLLLTDQDLISCQIDIRPIWEIQLWIRLDF